MVIKSINNKIITNYNSKKINSHGAEIRNGGGGSDQKTYSRHDSQRKLSEDVMFKQRPEECKGSSQVK